MGKNCIGFSIGTQIMKHCEKRDSMIKSCSSIGFTKCKGESTEPENPQDDIKYSKFIKSTENLSLEKSVEFQLP